MRWFFYLKLTLLLFWGIVLAITVMAQETKPQLVWKGCGISRKAFMAECAEAYEKKTGVHIELVGGGATLGIRATIAGMRISAEPAGRHCPIFSRNRKAVDISHRLPGMPFVSLPTPTIR